MNTKLKIISPLLLMLLASAGTTLGGEVLLSQTDSDEFTDLTSMNNFIYGNAGNDDINGGAGDDILSGNAGADSIDGGADNDFISGGYGNDNINGGDGDDYIVGGMGDDKLFGGEGNDTLYGWDGAYIKLKSSLYPDITYSLDSDTGNVTVTQSGQSYGGDLMVVGTYDGNSHAGYASLSNVDDSSDQLTGGPGDDVLYGGKGADVFVFAPGDGNDMIMDYDLEDTIDLTAFDSNVTLKENIGGSEHTITIGDVTIKVMVDSYLTALPVER